MFNLDLFIDENITYRQVSMFQGDIEQNYRELKERICDKSILVIGGAGSIGSSFIKALLPFKPGELCIVDINENALTELTRDLRSSEIFIPKAYLAYPMDYSSVTFQRMLRNHQGFDIVGNFSAHKHVRSEKDIYSVEALLRNNVINAKTLLDLLTEFPPETYFCVSTDKAANPVNIMGASKRIMEDLIFSYSDCFPVKTARFANVAFSNGSLLDGFLKRILKRQPFSAPSDVKRYFVSPQESGQICLAASILGSNREIFYPKLIEAQMMTFDVIAEKLLQSLGYKPLRCNSEKEAKECAIRFTDDSQIYPVYFSKSDTSGEKMFEEFYTKEETVDENRYISLGVITGKEKPQKEKVIDFVDNISGVLESGKIEKKDIINIISSYLPGFGHIEMGKSLDEKM